MNEQDRVAHLEQRRSGKRVENGLQSHLRIVHGYALTSLAGLTVIQLVFRHKAKHPVQRVTLALSVLIAALTFWTFTLGWLLRGWADE